MGDEKKKEEAKALPKNQASWWCEYKTKEGKILTGSFTFKRLTIAELGRLGALISQFNGGLPVDKITGFIHTQLAHFRLSVIASPEWWRPEEEFDAALLGKVFDALMAFEDTFQPAEPSEAAGNS